MKTKKKLKEITPKQEFNENIASILAEAISANAQPVPVAVQQPIPKPEVKKPCIVFHGEPDITMEDIHAKADDSNYNVTAATLSIMDDGNFILGREYTMRGFCDSVINNTEGFAINDGYKQAIMNGDAINATDLILDTRHLIASNIAFKATNAVYQKVMYAAKFSLDTFVKYMVNNCGYTSVDTFVDYMNRNTENRNMGYIIFPSDINMYIDGIGAAVRETLNGSPEECYDNAFYIIYNNIINAMVSGASKYANDIVASMRSMVYCINNGLDADDATQLFLAFNDVFKESMDNIMQSIMIDAQVITNEVVMAAATTYGTAELPNCRYSRYDYDF